MTTDVRLLDELQPNAAWALPESDERELLPSRPLVEVKFADLFAGIGGFHAALAGSKLIAGECAYASEIDPECSAVYKQNFGVQPDGDIWPVALRNPGLIPDFHLLCAGFPCQPFSKSGHQRGFAEARGTLFDAILRVLQAKRPRFVLLENVRNLIGPRHRDTWATIVRLLRDLGYAVSSDPSLLSPHELPPGIGSPQVRDRVFIPAVYVGRRVASESAAFLPALVQRPVFPDWDPAAWRVLDYLDEETDSPSQPDATQMIKPERVEAINMWDEFVSRLTVPVPRFPIWTDVFLGRLTVSPDHPAWKNALIRKNQEFFSLERPMILAWMERWHVGGVYPSYRKLEWQAQGSERRLWSHAIQFRPSGVRVKPLTYLPALVAINQTSILGPRRLKLSVEEAGALQGFSTAFLGGHRFSPDKDAATAFKQFGNAVHVGVARVLAETLILGGQGPLKVPAEWEDLIAMSGLVRRSPEAIVRDDELPLEVNG